MWIKLTITVLSMFVVKSLIFFVFYYKTEWKIIFIIFCPYSEPMFELRRFIVALCTINRQKPKMPMSGVNDNTIKKKQKNLKRFTQQNGNSTYVFRSHFICDGLLTPFQPTTQTTNNNTGKNCNFFVLFGALCGTENLRWLWYKQVQFLYSLYKSKMASQRKFLCVVCGRNICIVCRQDSIYRYCI